MALFEPFLPDAGKKPIAHEGNLFALIPGHNLNHFFLTLEKKPIAHEEIYLHNPVFLFPSWNFPLMGKSRNICRKTPACEQEH